MELVRHVCSLIFNVEYSTTCNVVKIQVVFIWNTTFIDIQRMLGQTYDICFLLHLRGGDYNIGLVLSKDRKNRHPVIENSCRYFTKL